MKNPFSSWRPAAWFQWSLYLLIAVCGAWANHEFRKANKVIELGPNEWAVVNEYANAERQQ